MHTFGKYSILTTTHDLLLFRRLLELRRENGTWSKVTNDDIFSSSLAALSPLYSVRLTMLL